MFFDFLPGAGYVCAHRGARALAPENTMLAAELAVELGANFWELDVHKVADGTFMVFHDDVLSRTTDVVTHAGFTGVEPWSTHEYSCEELQQLDAGAWFVETDPYGTIASGDVSSETLDRMAGQKIPTLRQALEFSRCHNLPVNVEIKDQLQSPGDLSIVDDVLKLARETETENLILFSSFNHDYLSRMHHIAPAMPLAVLVEDNHPDDIFGYLKFFGAVGYHPDKNIIDPELVRSLASRGVKVSPYTVNDMDQAMSLIHAGCFGIITDFVHTLRQRLSKQP
nr:glycerophosphodiester phosphodiesterase family protein [uncultured Pseudodesulfovibrio sp.]